MTAVRVLAQAKLNLHLRVLAREDSGFHSLETIFHRIDLADELVVRATERGRSLDVAGGDTGAIESNLAWRAAEAYRQRAGWPAGFEISLTKRIPVGAGLGGGSADAAAVLRALDALALNPMGSHTLLQIAAGLGSDLPFLASDAVMAVAWGHGERMIGCGPLPRKEVLLFTPDVRVPTAEAYGWLDDYPRSSDGGGPLVMDPASLTTWNAISQFAGNDFEQPVIARHPQIGRDLARIREVGGVLTGMSGSGSTLFAVLDVPVTAERVRVLVGDFTRFAGEHGGIVSTTMTSIEVVQPMRVG